MKPAFERHAASLDQAWRTLQDSVLLKNQQSPYVGPNRDSTKDTADMTGAPNTFSCWFCQKQGITTTFNNPTQMSSHERVCQYGPGKDEINYG